MAGTYIIALSPADGGRRISADLHVQAQLVPGHHDDGVLVHQAARGVQVDLGRIWTSRRSKESRQRLETKSKDVAPLVPRTIKKTRDSP